MRIVHIYSFYPLLKDGCALAACRFSLAPGCILLGGARKSSPNVVFIFSRGTDSWATRVGRVGVRPVIRAKGEKAVLFPCITSRGTETSRWHRECPPYAGFIAHETYLAVDSAHFANVTSATHANENVDCIADRSQGFCRSLPLFFFPKSWTFIPWLLGRFKRL